MGVPPGNRGPPEERRKMEKEIRIPEDAIYDGKLNMVAFLNALRAQEDWALDLEEAIVGLLPGDPVGVYIAGDWQLWVPLEGGGCAEIVVDVVAPDRVRIRIDPDPEYKPC